MITFSRLSSQGSSPLVSRTVVSPVSRDLNGTVVNCFEGISSTDSVATTTIGIIDPGQFGKKVLSMDSVWRYWGRRGGDRLKQWSYFAATYSVLDNANAQYWHRIACNIHWWFWYTKHLLCYNICSNLFWLDLSIRSHSEQFSSDGVTVNLEWTLLNSQVYYQQLLRNVSINVDPQLSNVMFTGNMRVQLTLSYNTLYNVSVTQHSICQQLIIRTTFLELNYSKLYLHNMYVCH